MLVFTSIVYYYVYRNLLFRPSQPSPKATLKLQSYSPYGFVQYFVHRQVLDVVYCSGNRSHFVGWCNRVWDTHTLFRWQSCQLCCRRVQERLKCKPILSTLYGNLWTVLMWGMLLMCVLIGQWAKPERWALRRQGKGEVGRPRAIGDTQDALHGAHAKANSQVWYHSTCVQATYVALSHITSVFYFQVGPLVRHWTMRYEAKHNHFKKLAQNIS